LRSVENSRHDPRDLRKQNVEKSCGQLITQKWYSSRRRGSTTSRGNASAVPRDDVISTSSPADVHPAFWRIL
jgi:hypothetical protein